MRRVVPSHVDTPDGFIKPFAAEILFGDDGFGAAAASIGADPDFAATAVAVSVGVEDELLGAGLQ